MNRIFAVRDSMGPKKRGSVWELDGFGFGFGDHNPWDPSVRYLIFH